MNFLPQTLRHSIGLSPLVPVWALGVIVLAACVLCVIGLLNRAPGTLLRFLASAIGLLFLAGPQWLTQSLQSLSETALVIVDQSASMSLRDRAAAADRAAKILSAQSPGLHGLDLRVVSVRSAQGRGTRLFEALDQAASDIPPGRLAGAIFITDGQVHDIPQALPERLSPHDGEKGAPALPLHVILTGTGEETDRRLRILQAPPYAIVGQMATLRVEVDDLGPGARPGTRVPLTLSRGGEDALQREVEVGVPQDITLPITRPGPLLIGLSVSELPGEVSTRNNADVVEINGVRDRLKVLLISGTPNQGERVWRRLLKADPSVDLVHFTILRPPDKDDGTPLSDLALIAFPVRELFQEKIRQFDLIILDGFQNRSILPPAYLRNIADYVRNGGGLLLTAGPEFIAPGTLQDTAVGDILPAHVPVDGGLIEQAFRPALTDIGRRHPVTADLPGAPPPPGTAQGGANVWGPWYRALRPGQPQGEVLMTGPHETPLLVLDHVQKGRVALLLSDQIWLWSHGEGGGGPQSELLRRLSHWLMKEPELEEEQLSASILDDRLSITRRTTASDTPPAVTITAPDGKTRQASLHAQAPGIATAEVDAASPGIWQVDDGTHRAFAAPKVQDVQEFADLRATAQPLSPLVHASGGGIFWTGAQVSAPAIRLVEASGRLAGHDWIGFPERAIRTVSGQITRPILPAWLALVLCAGLVLLGWWREGRG